MEQRNQSAQGFRVGMIEIDLRAGELRKGGLKVKLQEQPFQVLALLLARSGEVVTREDLKKTLWPDNTFVDFDHSLNIAINKIREALGDSAENPRFVETLPKRGYRFIAPVARLESPDAAVETGTNPAEGSVPTESVQRRTGGWRYVVASLGGVAALLGLLAALNTGGVRDWLAWKIAPPQIQSLAVLPLENLSGDPKQDYFADGMTDALITNLGQVGALRVISRTSIVGYKRTKKLLPEIARELNVDAIVEGGVFRSGNRVRITAQLLYAPTDRHLWAQTYEGDVRDVLGLQAEVARNVANAILARLSPQAQARLSESRPIEPEAYEYYLKGALVGSSQQAMGPLQQAIKLQPDYAPAYAGLANRYYSLGLFGTLPPSEAYPRMKEASLEALERDDALPQAYDALGLVRLHYDWNWADAEKNFRRAIELNPNFADSHHDYAHYLLAMGRVEESVKETKRAVELDPLNAGLVACLGWHQLYANQYDQTIEQAQRAIRISPESFWVHLVLGWGYEQKGQFDQAIPAFQKAVALSKGRAITAAALGHAFAMSGNRSDAEGVLAELQKQSKQTYVPPYDVATIYLGLGDKEKTFEWLDKAYQEHSSYLIHVGWDPRFKLLRSDPRFQDLLRSIGLPQS